MMDNLPEPPVYVEMNEFNDNRFSRMEFIRLFNQCSDILKEINHIKKDVNKTNRKGMQLLITFVILYITSVFLAAFFVTKSNDQFEDILKAENLEIMNDLRQLYKECKDNPLNFDWTTQIFDRIEEVERKLPKKNYEYIIRKLSELDLDEFFKGMKMNNGLDDYHISLTLDRGTGIKIKTRSYDDSKEKPERGRRDSENAIPTEETKKRTKWIGPSGMPGYGR